MPRDWVHVFPEQLTRLLSETVHGEWGKDQQTMKLRELTKFLIAFARYPGYQ